MKLILMLLAVTGVLLASVGTVEAVRPLQLALGPPDAQLVPSTESVSGLRLSIYGRNLDVKGLDLGFVNETTGDFRGLSLSVANMVIGDGHGVEIGAVYNSVGKHHAGVQLGLINRAGSMKGIQIGLINYTNLMNGFQIGLWNEIHSKATWNVIPLFNGKF